MGSIRSTVASSRLLVDAGDDLRPLLLSAGLSVYMLIAIRYEERDLVGMFGSDMRIIARARAC